MKSKVKLLGSCIKKLDKVCDQEICSSCPFDTIEDQCDLIKMKDSISEAIRYLNERDAIYNGGDK
jgi:hypothetical protein